MSSPAVELAVWLAAQGVGTLGTDLFYNREPAGPDFCVTVYDTQGLPALQIDENMRRPAVMVRVRGHDYEAAYDKQQEVHGLLAVDNTSFETGDHRYIGVWLTSDILSLGRDDNDRALLTANYEIIRQPLEAAP